MRPSRAAPSPCPASTGWLEKTINLEHLRRIMRERVDETLRLVEEELNDRGITPMRSAGWCCAGAARASPASSAWPRTSSRSPPRWAGPARLAGLKSALDQPEFATGLGLVRFGAMQNRRRKAGGLIGSLFLPQRVKESVEQFLKRP